MLIHVEHVRCRQCKSLVRLAMPESGWQAYKAGELIQRALPTLTADEREILISGFCGPCYDKLFDDDGADPEDDTVETGIDVSGVEG